MVHQAPIMFLNLEIKIKFYFTFKEVDGAVHIFNLKLSNHATKDPKWIEDHPSIILLLELFLLEFYPKILQTILRIGKKCFLIIVMEQVFKEQKNSQYSTKIIPFTFVAII